MQRKEYIVFCIFFFQTFRVTNSAPNNNSPNKNIVGSASYLITKSLLQNHVDIKSNQVFSPFGFSSILTVLYEGANGDTATEIKQMLGLPEDYDDIRVAYDSILRNLSESNPQMAPQFKTWFYIYENNTVEAKYREIIKNFYKVEVKDIKRFEFIDGESTPSNAESTTEDLLFPDEVEKIKEDYEGVNKLKDEILKAEKNIEEDTSSGTFEKELGTINDEINKPDHINLSNENLESSDVIRMFKSHMTASKKYKSAITTDDVANALSGNSIVGKNSRQTSESDESESKMLLFNGMYFRGNWRHPFYKLKKDDVFYNITSQKSRVTMMRTHANFKTGYIKSLDSNAVEIPYENPRYSLLVVMPQSKSVSGIKTLIKNFDEKSMEEIQSNLKEEYIHLALPKFKVECTGRAEKALMKDGVTTLFTKMADLSGITKEQKIYVDELVQHVSIRVDEGAISQNFLTASNALRSSLAPNALEFVIDHPFLFFVQDVENHVVIIAGKITDIHSAKPFTFF